jgi:hypothetical protein
MLQTGHQEEANGFGEQTKSNVSIMSLMLGCLSRPDWERMIVACRSIIGKPWLHLRCALLPLPSRCNESAPLSLAKHDCFDHVWLQIINIMRRAGRCEQS